MYKKLAAVILLLFVWCGASWAETVYSDPFSFNGRYDSADEAVVYSRYGNLESGFFYQLRDITGASRQSQVAGPQWFATVYENYYTRLNRNDNNVATVYRRTMGGEIPDIAFSAIGDLLDGFNFVFAEEPQPYAAWRNYVPANVYDVYPDPVESLCLVITEGRGTFNVKFGNPYAKHFPFWWNYKRTDTGNTYNPSWWKNEYDWRDITYPTVEPIRYIYNGGYIYGRENNYSSYERVYKISTDDSGDRYVTDLDGQNILLKISGDSYYDPSGSLEYVVDDDRVYNASHELVYTLEHTAVDEADGSTYICSVRDITESVTVGDFEDTYNIAVLPNADSTISSGGYLQASMNINGYGTPYGSTLGYLTFRQRASFAEGYSNYREFLTVPMVIANVTEGNAATNPLLFDMTIRDSSNTIVNRVKFEWDVQGNRTQDLGTFFLITPEGVNVNPYTIETKITNNTGTRYELYRYDMIRGGDEDSANRDNYSRIWPSYWKYNLTPDRYGTLPDYFLLDAQSQIAPGLVTVYRENLMTGDGYTTIDLDTDTHESFRLYEYDANTPRNLRLNYKRIRGMTSAGLPQDIPEGAGTIQGFNMKFVDIQADSKNTNDEIRRIMGQYDDDHKDPAMILASSAVFDATTLQTSYIRAAASNAFTISKSINEAELDPIPTYYPLISVDSSFVAASDPSNDRNTHSSDRVALLPVKVRLKIRKDSQLLENHWEELDRAGSSRELFNKFASFGTIWVRSDATNEKDANLFSAIAGNKGGYSGADCISAFTDDNNLYLDFIVIVADAVSAKNGSTAFIAMIEDDGVPYIFIGDVAVDKKWDLTFYVDAAGENPGAEYWQDDGQEDEDEAVTVNSSSGGSCNLGLAGVMGLMVLAVMMKRK